MGEEIRAKRSIRERYQAHRCVSKERIDKYMR